MKEMLTLKDEHKSKTIRRNVNVLLSIYEEIKNKDTIEFLNSLKIYFSWSIVQL